MKTRIWDKTGARDLKLSVFISLGIHLFFILTTPVLFSSADVRRAPIRYVKVTVYPLGDDKRSVSGSISPLSVIKTKNLTQKEFKQEQKQKETILKNEFEPPKPLPVQAEVRTIPAEESTLTVSSREDEKIKKAPETPVVVASLNTDLTLKKEEDPVLLRDPPSKGESLPAPLTPPPQGASLGASVSGSVSGQGPGTGQEGGGGGSGNGPGAGKGGFHWRGIGEATGEGQGRTGGGGSGSGSGAGTGSGDRSSREGGSRKGGGILSKLFSSSGRATGGYPRYAENPKPLYPQEAREKGYHGEVLLRVEVLSNGRVGQIEIKRSSGHDVLDQSALSTVKQWKFIPAKRGEDTISLWVNVPIKFQLQ